MSNAYRFTFSGLEIIEIAEFEDGVWQPVTPEPNKVWSYDGNQVTAIEYEDSQPKISKVYTDVDGDGIFARTEGDIFDNSESTIDSSEVRNDAYRFVFAPDGAITEIREYEDGVFALRGFEPGESWVRNSDGTVTETEVGDDSSKIYADLDGDGVFTLIAKGSTQYANPSDYDDIDDDGSDDDYLSGSSNDDYVDGGRGDDDIETGDGDDYVRGGDGEDMIHGGSGRDRIQGGGGDDIIRGGDGDDYIGGGAGSDRVDYSDAIVAMSVNLGSGTATGSGNDRLVSIEDVTGGDGNDSLRGNADENEIRGGHGADDIQGGAGNDTLHGGDDDDSVSGGNGDDLIIAGDGAGDDHYSGGFGDDTVSYSGALAGVTVDLSASSNHGHSTDAADAAGIGIDQLTGIEHLVGGKHSDRLTGNSGGNHLEGDDGNDVFDGRGGNDSLSGGRGSDRLSGGVGDDWLQGGKGRDILSGNSGADNFVFDDGEFAGLTGGTADRILDFSIVGGDKIHLASVDANTANGSVDDSFTFIGTDVFNGVAGELRYNTNSGNTFVYGDRDGDANADFMIRIDGVHALSSSDFLL